MNTGETIELKVTDVAHGGVFVGRIGAEDGRGGRVIFVPDAIPGETVTVRLSDTRKSSFWRGEVLAVTDASPHRQPHVWTAADLDVAPEDRPGGADFGHIELSHQRELKLHVLRDALSRFGGMDAEAIAAATLQPAPDVRDAHGEVVASESADGTGWRTRVSLHVDEEGRVGPFAARSHRVIRVDSLPLATAAVQRAAERLEGRTAGRLDLVQPADDRVRVIARADDAKRRPTVAKDPAREVIRERVGAREFLVDAGGFWQVHRLAASALDGLVGDAIDTLAPGGLDPEAQHLDLYGGVGLFAAALGDRGARRIVSVESDPRATDNASENLAEWLGARAETARVDRWLNNWSTRATDRDRERVNRGVVVLDPPRSGAGREVVDALVSAAPAGIVYVACDPVALARDISTFRAAGYEPRSIRAVDLFPHSHHIETVVTLSR
ncbi:tRNA/tmRNA/rRNA uracil-C5-methylase (TrmA/RlmC/RlmD family) [Microbacterium endophyticum]|uniref:tRNA/tmRNA/rRNA uracil-C5-methylase (TrmA/RlmC/RlmD family) n=1 Tax=Microbacterium endophyticum TaxID=1526412 RepID=A0A7W4V3U5_9MICO|nr:class I SAM-dependent RNA methyltransferase [Microbacterium endophyticum]MBB2976367.1 tRNA/tmRNA/rRNA uracil-C5-methylase (TrmA/RlmC/RlmD family) [Microbacterium endophyticum]NIK35248.1 tRNA/tmRNA/rRNA uracil-C5-methylase (TrmA/RlmC/RlmD family) [Microbacterium endophyticum]